MSDQNPRRPSRGLLRGTQVSSIFIDESGSKNSAGGFFVVGFVKARSTPALRRDMRAIRQRHGHYKEAKFGGITKGSLPFYFDVVELLARSDARIGGSVYDAREHFVSDMETWEVQASMSGQLVIGNVVWGEVVNVFLDVVETPQGESVAQRVQDRVNGTLGVKKIIAAYDLDSASTDMLQLADLVAGAIAYERKHAKECPASSELLSPKGQVAARMRRAFGLESFDDVRTSRVNILTMKSAPKALPGLDL